MTRSSERAGVPDRNRGHKEIEGVAFAISCRTATVLGRSLDQFHRFYCEDSGNCFPREIRQRSFYFQNHSAGLSGDPLLYGLASSRESLQELGVELPFDFYSQLHRLRILAKYC